MQMIYLFYFFQIDHFSFTNNATYKMRYLINDTYWDPENNAPIFFYTGNEGDITLFAQNTVKYCNNYLLICHPKYCTVTIEKTSV